MPFLAARAGKLSQELFESACRARINTSAQGPLMSVFWAQVTNRNRVAMRNLTQVILKILMEAKIPAISCGARVADAPPLFGAKNVFD